MNEEGNLQIAGKLGNLEGQQAATDRRVGDMFTLIRDVEKKLGDTGKEITKDVRDGFEKVMKSLENKASHDDLKRIETTVNSHTTELKSLSEGQIRFDAKTGIVATIIFFIATAVMNFIYQWAQATIFSK